ncbi:MAG: HelD family protein [Acidimicrobiales bacterium]
MAADRDIAEEQRILDDAYRGLEAMRREANRMLESVLDLGRGGTFQSRTERDIVVRTSLARLAQLDIGDQALCFGRIDRRTEGDGGLESFHIGRLAVSGEHHEPLVVDWRAPVAEPFYRATGLDPQGLARRRHLAVRGRTVVGVEDEYFAQPGGGAGGPGRPDAGAPEALFDGGLALGGPGALLAALGQARTGHMADIVGTIQREQDEIIRSPLAGVLLVQGGPGTGKTAVALHRAAYLLYTHRFPLERQGVLVVGPNPLFLRYIEQVLPSLGETGVTLSTVSGLVPEVRVRASDPPEVARLKGEARMARVIVQAVRTRQRALRRDVAVPFGATTLRLSAGASAEIVSQARRRAGTHNARRRFVEQQVVRRLADQYERVRRAGGPGSPADGPPASSERDLQLDLFVGPDAEAAAADVGALDLDEFGRQVRQTPELSEALDRMWPRLAPHELLHDLLGAPPLLAAAGKGILTAAEQAMLQRPRSASLDEVGWTAADAALVDEARTILGPRRTRGVRSRAAARERAERARQEVGYWPAGLDPNPTPVGVGAEEDGVRAFGHIVVDEVQDLSPLQLRMLARRSLSGSMTAVGDIAQSTGPWAPQSWDDVAAHLTPNRAPKLVELTVSYRTPAEVVEVAARVLAVAAPDLAPPRPVRRSGEQPVLSTVAPAELAFEVARAARSEADAVAPGRAAVLVPAHLMGEVGRALAEHGLEAVDPRDPAGEGLAAALVLLPASECNGLEFDSVVVVEPALIAAGETVGREGPPLATTRGLRTLYVALTRPTRRLAVVSSGPLPAGLALA